MKLVFATNNKNKLKEIRNILGSSFELYSLDDLKINDDIPENEPTLEGNALHKARYINNLTHLDVFADDTGLEVKSLNGLPGVHSARFSGEKKDPAENNRKLLRMLENVQERSARFRTVIALILDNQEYLFDGIVEGMIIREERGSMGFGYDPVFIPDGQNLTFAEMTLDKKNMISHRARAFNKLREFLTQYQKADNKERV